MPDASPHGCVFCVPSKTLNTPNCAYYQPNYNFSRFYFELPTISSACAIDCSVILLPPNMRAIS